MAKWQVATYNANACNISKLDGKYSERELRTSPLESYCELPPQWGCAVNGTAVAAVLIDQSRSFVNLHIRYVYWIAARLPNCEICGFLSPTLGNTCHAYY